MDRILHSRRQSPPGNLIASLLYRVRTLAKRDAVDSPLVCPELRTFWRAASRLKARNGGVEAPWGEAYRPVVGTGLIIPFSVRFLQFLPVNTQIEPPLN
jgi:hypothetical protein